MCANSQVSLSLTSVTNTGICLKARVFSKSLGTLDNQTVCLMQVLAVGRKTLRQQSVKGLHQTPLLKALIQRLPVILQEQYTHEKVSS